MRGTNQGHTFQFPPVTTPVHAVEIASGMHAASRSDGFNGGDLSNDLKVHDVSASSSSALQIHDTYASIALFEDIDTKIYSDTFFRICKTDLSTMQPLQWRHA